MGLFYFFFVLFGFLGHKIRQTIMEIQYMGVNAIPFYQCYINCFKKQSQLNDFYSF